MIEKRYIPTELRRQLRQECCFCCPYCGCPILEYHHVVPWADIKRHVLEKMIALCPTCHALADNGTITKAHLYSLKKMGISSPGWKNSLKFYDEEFSVKVGPTKFLKRDSGCLIRVNNNPLLTIDRSEHSNVILNTSFYDKKDRRIFGIDDNELWIETRSIWDIEYVGRTLTIRKRARGIALEMEATSDGLWFRRGEYSFGGATYQFNEKQGKIETGNTTVKLGDNPIGTINIDCSNSRIIDLPLGFRNTAKPTKHRSKRKSKLRKNTRKKKR